MPPNNVINSGLPLPGVYKEKQLAAEQAYQQALADLGSQQQGLFNQYGFQGQVGDNGAINGLQINPNQQFGLVQQLLRSQAGSRSDLKNQLSGRGLGKTGLSAQRKRLLNFLQQGDFASLGQRFGRGVSDIARQRGLALGKRQGDFNDAEAEALAYALANGLFDTPAGNNTGGAVGGGGLGTVGGETVTGVTGNVFPNTPTVTTAQGGVIPGGVARAEQQFGNDFDPQGAQQALANTMAGVRTPVIEPPAYSAPAPTPAYDPIIAPPLTDAQRRRQAQYLKGAGF